MVKSRVTEYWESYLWAEASGLLSLKYFKPEYMSLVKPHPLWLTCGSNPFEVNKAVIQAGCYLEDTTQICLPVTGQGILMASVVDLKLAQCQALMEVRRKMMKLMYEVSEESPQLYHIISWVPSLPTGYIGSVLVGLLQFVHVANMCQKCGNKLKPRLFLISRNWCYSIHRRRMTQIDKNKIMLNVYEIYITYKNFFFFFLNLLVYFGTKELSWSNLKLTQSAC